MPRYKSTKPLILHVFNGFWVNNVVIHAPKIYEREGIYAYWIVKPIPVSYATWFDGNYDTRSKKPLIFFPSVSQKIRGIWPVALHHAR
jgi:hypothetical protein